MKLVKLSLVAALAAGAFSVANATPLEEAIKDIDVSGVLRYRYESGNIDDVDTAGLAGEKQLINSKQNHKYRAQINFNAAIADNFKAFVQLDYNAKDGGYGTLYGNAADGTVYNDNESVTKEGLSVRQLYLTYTNEDFATSVIAGKQQLNTIWTDNGIDGLVGTGIKVVNNSVDGLTLAAFAVDSYNFDEQAEEITPIFTKTPANAQNPDLNSINVGNLYGGAAIGSYEALGGQFDSQLWAAYWDMVGAFYALDLAYGTTLFDSMNWKINAAYLGNYLDKTDIENGNFFGLRGTIEWNGFDASLGGLYYGDKEQATLTVIEDQGNIGHLLAGQEIFYSEGSHLNGDVGENTFGYITGGYTFNEVLRLGADFVYGGTKTNYGGTQLAPHGGEKFEAVARVDYKYSPKLSFQAWYSYLNIDQDRNGEGQKDTVRLQALYKF